MSTQSPAHLICHRASNGFTPIPNQTILDARHSMAALGLLCYLLMRGSTPGGWMFYVSEIVNNFDTGKKGDEVNNRLRELERLGYLYRSQGRDERGRMTQSRWVVSDLPVLGGEEGAKIANGEIESSQPSVQEIGTAKVADMGPLPEVDPFGTPTPASQPVEPKPCKRKSKQQIGERVKQSTFESAVVELWNGNNPGHWVNKRAISSDERRLLGELLSAHDSDEQRAIETLREAVEQVAWYGGADGRDDRRALFWNGRDGQGGSTHPGLVNLLSGAKWLKHAEARADRAAQEDRQMTHRNEPTQTFNVADFGV